VDARKDVCHFELYPQKKPYDVDQWYEAVEVALADLEFQRNKVVPEYGSGVCCLRVLHAGFFGGREHWKSVVRDLLVHCEYPQGSTVFLILVNGMPGQGAKEEEQLLTLCREMGFVPHVVTRRDADKKNPTYEEHSMTFIYHVMQRLKQEVPKTLPYTLVSYTHTKGMTHTEALCTNWRRMMSALTTSKAEHMANLIRLEREAELAGINEAKKIGWSDPLENTPGWQAQQEQPEELARYTAGWDVAGVLWSHNVTHDCFGQKFSTQQYFAGNFWLARGHYLVTLPCPVNASRYACETWIGARDPRAVDTALVCAAKPMVPHCTWKTYGPNYHGRPYVVPANRVECSIKYLLEDIVHLEKEGKDPDEYTEKYWVGQVGLEKEKTPKVVREEKQKTDDQLYRYTVATYILLAVVSMALLAVFVSVLL